MGRQGLAQTVAQGFNRQAYTRRRTVQWERSWLRYRGIPDTKAYKGNISWIWRMKILFLQGKIVLRRQVKMSILANTGQSEMLTTIRCKIPTLWLGLWHHRAHEPYADTIEMIHLIFPSRSSY